MDCFALRQLLSCPCSHFLSEMGRVQRIGIGAFEGTVAVFGTGMFAGSTNSLRRYSFWCTVVVTCTVTTFDLILPSFIAPAGFAWSSRQTETR